MAKFTKVHRDANHIEIVKDLKSLLYAVIDLAAVGRGVPDIIVSDEAVTALIEIKVSDKGTNFYLTQLEFLARWPGVCGFAETTDDCLRLMRDPETYRLKPYQRKIILKIVDIRRQETKNDFNPRIGVKKFEAMFKEMCEAPLTE